MSETVGQLHSEAQANLPGQFAVAVAEHVDDSHEHKLGVPINDREVERRFLVRSSMLPYITVNANKVEDITQGYFRDAEGIKYRLRKTVDRATGAVTCMINRKERTTGESRLSRLEPKVYIPEEVYDAFLPLTEQQSLTKTRYHVSWHGMPMEIDDWGDPDWVIAEIEFNSEEEALDPNLKFPDWFGPEVTEDKRWGMASIAKHGTPPIDLAAVSK